MRETGLAVLAVQQIRRMRGGAQGQLMLGADGHIYVVKFQNNPQHHAGAGQRVAGDAAGGGGGVDGAGEGAGGGFELADRKYAGAGDRPGTDARALPAGIAVRIAVCRAG